MIDKPVNVAFISQKLKEQFESLNSGKFEDQQLYKFIDRALDDIKKDPTCGIKIPKKLWPREYVKNRRAKTRGVFLSMLRNRPLTSN